MKEECIFCDEFVRGDNTFAETELWRARWDRYPATPGHVEVLPKRHVQYFEQLTDAVRDSMVRFVHKAMRLICKMPRWKGDIANPRGGVRNLFPQDPYGRL